VDIALWDLSARLHAVPLVEALGAVHEDGPVYGSGGFTSYDDHQLAGQLTGWAEAGIPRVKIKVGRDPDVDSHRVDLARRTVGDDVELFVDANGAYSRKQALALAEHFCDSGVTWFEEPVSSDDLEGLALLVQRMPAALEVAAGEYGYAPLYFERMLLARAVDVLQADATRCGGVTGFSRAALLCDVHQMPLSCHCAPALHTHLGCAAGAVRHLEYFHDHIRIERLLFDGVVEPRDGCLEPDRSRSGLGLELRHADAQRFLIAESTARKAAE